MYYYWESILYGSPFTNKWYARNDVDYSFDFKGLYLVLKLLTLNNVYDRNGKLTRFQSLLGSSFWHANLQTEL